jgi:hypothetical protein
MKVQRVTLHGRRDHQGVVPLVFLADVLMEEGEGGFLGREGHGKTINHEGREAHDGKNGLGDESCGCRATV